MEVDAFRMASAGILARRGLICQRYNAYINITLPLYWHTLLFLFFDYMHARNTGKILLNRLRRTGI